MTNKEDKNKEKGSIIYSNPHEKSGDEKEKSQMIEKVGQTPTSFEGDSMKESRMMDVSYQKSLWGSIKRRWYFYIPAILLILFVVLLELFHSVFK